MLVLALVAVLLALTYYYFTSSFSYWRDKGVVFVKAYPVVGSMLSIITMREHMTQFFERVYYTHADKPYVGYFQGRTPALLVRDPELIKHIVVKDFSHFVDHGIKFDKEADPLSSNNLFNMDGQRWKEMRSVLSPTFTSGRMKLMFPLVLESANKLEKHLEQISETGEFTNMKDLLARYTTSVIASSVFGVDCDAINEPNLHFSVMSRKLLETDVIQGLKIAILAFIPELNKVLKPSFIKEECARYFRSLVGDVMALRSSSGETRHDFLQLLIKLKEGSTSAQQASQPFSDKKLTDDEILAQAMVFFFAGFETSSSTLAFAMFELAQRPELQQRARREIEEVLQRHSGEVTYQAIQEMTYLDCVINETLRLYPSLSVLQRECTKNYQVPGTQMMIEAGTPILIPIKALQNDPQYFPYPQTFDPERFSEGNTKKDPYVYMPFGEGPRQCIGMRFARMQSKLGLVSLLRRFKVHPSPGSNKALTFDPRQFLLSANENITMQFGRVD